MGKRAKKVTLKKMAKPKLETVFSCPLCSHEKCIECKMDRQSQVGTARCRVCSAGYQTVISYLSDPVDVYGEWVDVIAEREKQGGGRVESKSGESRSGREEDGISSGAQLPRFNVKQQHENRDDSEQVDSDEPDEKSSQNGFESIDSESSDVDPTDNKPADKIQDATSTDSDDQFEALISNMHNKKHNSPKKTAIVESESESE